MQATAYLRVSSKAQDHAMQRAAIERAAQARGDTIAQWFAEKTSGRTLARPELDRLRLAARGDNIRRLYVYRLDRLSRSGIRDTFELVEEFRSRGCHIVTVADGFDLDGPAADIILAVMAWAAKMERLAINERIAAARLRLELEGKPWGRPSIIDPATLQRIRALQKDGRSVRAIAMAVHKSRSAVQRALSRKDSSKTHARSTRRHAPHQGASRK